MSRCIIPVAATVGPLGVVISIQGLSIFELFGAHRLLSSLVGISVIRELAPVMASVLVAAQGGSSFAAELGAMRIREEIDATEVMAVDPFRIHVAPRLLASIIATPTLTLAGVIAGIGASYATAVVSGESGGIFLANLFNLSAPVDVFAGLIKAIVFGVIIGLVSCYQGYYTTGGAAGVGIAVNRTVVISITGMIVANYILSSILFGATP